MAYWLDEISYYSPLFATVVGHEVEVLHHHDWVCSDGDKEEVYDDYAEAVAGSVVESSGDSDVHDVLEDLAYVDAHGEDGG